MSSPITNDGNIGLSLSAQSPGADISRNTVLTESTPHMFIAHSTQQLQNPLKSERPRHYGGYEVDIEHDAKVA